MAEERETVLSNADTDYERADWNLAVVAGAAALTLVLLVVIPLVLRGAYPHAMSDANRKAAALPPGPQLQTDAPADLRDFRAEETARLDSYGWVDRSHGIAHIPIAEAMKDLVAKGYPDFPKAKQSAQSAAPQLQPAGQ